MSIYQSKSRDYSLSNKLSHKTLPPTPWTLIRCRSELELREKNDFGFYGLKIGVKTLAPGPLFC